MRIYPQLEFSCHAQLRISFSFLLLCIVQWNDTRLPRPREQPDFDSRIAEKYFRVVFTHIGTSRGAGGRGCEGEGGGGCSALFFVITSLKRWVRALHERIVPQNPQVEYDSSDCKQNTVSSRPSQHFLRSMPSSESRRLPESPTRGVPIQIFTFFSTLNC